MSYNSIGKILKLTTWGESHGTEIGAVLDGCLLYTSPSPRDS